MVHRWKQSYRLAVVAMSLVCLHTTPLRAVDDLLLTVAPGSESVLPGDTVTVTLDVANLSSEINGVQALFSYDASVLSLFSIITTDLNLFAPSAGWVDIHFSDNNGDIVYAVVINGGFIIADDTIATMTFDVIDEGMTGLTFTSGIDPFLTKLTVASDNSTILPPTTNSLLITSTCSDGVFCNGLETFDGLICQPGSDPCFGQTCDEINDLCFSPIHVVDLEVFYADRFRVCVGGDRDGLTCFDNDPAFACTGTSPTPNGTCTGPEQADPSHHFLASGTIANTNNIINYTEGITGIRVIFDNIVTYATTPDAAFLFEWSNLPECVGGDRDGLICFVDNDCTGTTPTPNGTCEVLFEPVLNVATNVSVTSIDVNGQTEVSITIADGHIRRRWLRVTLIASDISSNGSLLDGELIGNPILFPSGDGTPDGDAVFYLGQISADVDDNRKVELTDPGLIRNCVCFNPFLQAPITEMFDVDKDGHVVLTDVGKARAEVNPFFTLTLISP